MVCVLFGGKMLFFDEPVKAKPRHPAKYTPALYPVMAGYLRGCARILDPFGGVGGVFDLLAWLPDARIDAIEIEPDWAAADARITLGNALSLPWGDATFDAICTSPTYGNRMADHHDARDDSRRNTYRHTLGRPLQADNAGAMQWGESYRRFHLAAWMEARRVLRPGAVFVLNIKDHYRQGRLQHVTDWHVGTLQGLGFTQADRIDVRCPGNRHGANGHARAEYEAVIQFRLTPQT
jgi:hypothetical protein